MRLAAFIRSDEVAIVAAWEDFAETYLPSAAHMDRVALRDHIIGLLRFIADDLDTPQTERERSEKAKGQGSKDGGANDSAAETHADLRFTSGFDTIEMVSEFRALRASVIKLWRAAWDDPEDIIPDLLRFNESIDQVMTESLSRYTEKLTYAGTLFVGTLQNGFRVSLKQVSSSAQALAGSQLDEQQKRLVSQIKTGTAGVDMMVYELIDAVHIRIGAGMTMNLAPSDIGAAMKDVVTEFEEGHPGQKIAVKAAGDLTGSWDIVRIRQMLSILFVSAVKHGSKASKILVAAKANDREVTLSVNIEDALSPETVATLFDPANQRQAKGDPQTDEDRLDLGLFIAEGIVNAHGGRIDVVSDEKQGTTFSAYLPIKR